MKQITVAAIIKNNKGKLLICPRADNTSMSVSPAANPIDLLKNCGSYLPIIIEKSFMPPARLIPIFTFICFLNKISIILKE